MRRRAFEIHMKAVRAADAVNAKRDAVVYYCGCLNSVGHFVYGPGEWRYGNMNAPEGCPWSHLDSSKITPPGPGKQGNAVLRHKDGWTVLSIHDYTIDKRPGSHSTFATAAELDYDAMLAAAREAWPEIVERVGSLTLVALDLAPCGSVPLPPQEKQ